MKRLLLILLPLMVLMTGCVDDRDEYVRVFNDTGYPIYVGLSAYDEDVPDYRLMPGDFIDIDVYYDVVAEYDGYSYTMLHYRYERGVIYDVEIPLTFARNDVHIYGPGDVHVH